MSALYVAVVKFIAMPSVLNGGDDLLFMYSGLLPAGRHSFAWVLASVFANPVFTITSLLEEVKLVYVLLTLVPLAFVPLRRGIGFLAMIPGILFCLLGTKFLSLTDIHYQYSPHVLAFAFPAAVFVLGSIAGLDRSPAAPLDRAALVAALVAIAAATLPCSYQYGAVFQQNTSVAGPIPYKFGWDDEGRTRQRAMERIKKIVPPSAKVAASAFVVPQFSARPDDYSLSIALFDADWIVGEVKASALVGDEAKTIDAELRSGRFGVVAIDAPFFVARRGAPTGQNAALRQLLWAR
jgi:uncharacterized membrane protein